MNKWGEAGAKVNVVDLKVENLEQIPKLMQTFNESATWKWRFGETPDFVNSIEKKFDWALVDF